MLVRPVRYDLPVTEPTLHFSSSAGRVELESYSEVATLADLVRGVETARLQTSLAVSQCAGCGKCCYEPIPVIGTDIPQLAAGMGVQETEVLDRHLVWPESRPSGEERHEAIRELARGMSMSDEQAAYAYDFNNGEPVILPRAADGACRFLDVGLCTIYEHRPLACRIYLCAMGDQLSMLQEGIVHHGTWHLYSRAGWIAEAHIAANPFLKALSWETVPIASFAPLDPGDPEDLFFFF